MRATGLLGSACCLLFLAATSSRPPSKSAGRPEGSGAPHDLQELGQEGARLFASGRYGEAAAAFERAFQSARRAGDLRLQARFLNNLGGCRLAIFQYRKAMAAFLEACRLAERRGDYDAAAAIWSNIATLYMQMGELEQARAAAERALDLSQRHSVPSAQLLLRVATLRARAGNWVEAAPLFRQSVDLADRAGDLRAVAQVWRTLGYECLRAGRADAAEPALIEAFRLHLLSGAPDLHFSYRNLALLRAAQGDLHAASRLMDLALTSARSTASPAPLWSMYHQRGRLRLRQQRLLGALEDFRRAVDLARRWRSETLPAESFRISLDVGLHDLYASLLETAAELYFRTGRAELAREAFEAAEENRAASLRAELLFGDEEFGPLPAAYGQTLAEMRAAETALLARESAALRQRLQKLRQQLVQMELEAGLDSARSESFRWQPRGLLLRRIMRSLGQQEAFLAFHLGEQGCYRWSLTRRQFRMDRLPPRSEIVARVEGFREAVRKDLPETERLGRDLYTSLFGGLSPGVLAKPVWLLSLDGPLFELPVGALIRDEPRGRSVYLVEQHALELLPGAHMVVDVRHEALWRGRFVGVGDAIYNMADPRWSRGRHEGGREGFWELLPRLRAARALADLELPRLPGSGEEVRVCAAQWPSALPPVVLEGPQATWEALEQALAPGAAILHLATHVVPSSDRSRQAFIAMSPGPDGKPQMIGPATVRALRRAAQLVVLSGCNSGRGPAVPGAGLLGLTRAWLAAGSRAVLASLWQAPDDHGEMFQAFYRRLGGDVAGGVRAPALALQRAQRDMLASGGWRARPAYWAAYFLVGVQ